MKTNDQIRDEACKRANELADEIRRKAIAAGCSEDVRVIGYALGVGYYFQRRYDGHVEISFEALAGGRPRRRKVNDCKKPIDVDKIVALLVEHDGYRKRQSQQWRLESDAQEANEKVAEELRALVPWLTITARTSGLWLSVDAQTPAQARAIVDALKVLP